MSVPAEGGGMIGRDEHRNPIWVRGDGPYADMPGLAPAPVVEAEAAATIEPEETEAKTGAGTGAAADAGTAEEVDPFDEDEALAAAAEEEAAAEAADVPPERPAGLVGSFCGNPIWVRGDGPYADLKGLTAAPFIEPSAGPSESIGGDGEDAEDEDEDDEDEEAAADRDRGRGSERFAKSDDGGERNRDGRQDSSNRRGQSQRGGGGGGAVASTSVWVGKLPTDVTMQVLHDAFKHFGDIIGVNLQPRQPGDNSDGCGVVNFANPTAARAAMQMMQGAEVGGSRIHVRPVADPNSGMNGGRRGGGNASGERRIPVAGDGDNWECPSCDNVNWPFRTACHRCKAPRPAGMGSDDSRQQSGQGRGRNYSHSGHVQRQPMPKRTRHAYNSDRDQGDGRGESGARIRSSESGNRNPSSRGEWRGEEPPSEPSGGLLLA